MWTNETEKSGIEVTSASGGVEEVGFPSFLPPVLWKVGRGVGFQMRSLETIFGTPRRNGQGPDSSLKRLLIFIWTRVQNRVALGIVTQYSRFWAIRLKLPNSLTNSPSSYISTRNSRLQRNSGTHPPARPPSCPPCIVVGISQRGCTG